VLVLLVDVTAKRRAEEEAEAARLRERMTEERFEGFIANVPGIVWETWFAPDASLQRVDYVSNAVEAMSGYTAEEWTRPNFWLELIHPDDRARAEASSRAVFERRAVEVDYRWITKDGRIIWVATRMNLIRDEAGMPIGMRGLTMDVSDFKVAEQERADTRVREEVLRAKEESLLALSTPLVPIGDDLMAMPLVGELDSGRLKRIIEALLAGVAATRAKTVIVDVTGVPSLNAETADGLIRAARAVELLGAEVVLSGLRPDVARTHVELGVELGRIVTRGTLKSGIDYAMTRHRQ
jgi:rsbT co-antagonist protein RsbR